MKKIGSAGAVDPILVFTIVAVVCILAVASFFDIMAKNDKKNASAEVKQEIYYVTAVASRRIGEYADLLMSLSTTSGEISFRKSNRGEMATPYIFKVGPQYNFISYKIYGASDEKWTRLRFENSEAFNDFNRVIVKYGEPVGSCYDMTECNIFLF